ncbi:aminoglycoside phosphotransferase family protein [Konateibacter massiliensis]|uniref:aminoglycoside phosphotransferase family protein n=1 Tax=Konateibacter massiliensis TaxID=2002841 RepID=UPI000C14EF77|nr:aminoglycoside phosphotransferase family protein [Konateibacter massiliensis]
MKILNGILENLFDTGIENITINQCSNGDVNSSYIASYKSEKYFIKIQDKKHLPNLYENQIEREVIGTTLCKKQGIPCPKILDYNLDEKFIITEYMDYELLGSLWGLLDVGEQKYVKDQTLRIIEKMHHIESNYFGGICKSGKIEQFSQWTDSYKNIVEIALGDCLRYESITENEREIIINKVNENCKKLNQKPQSNAVFSHLDLHWNNIFIDKNTKQIVGVFDFGSALYTPHYMGYFRLNNGFLYGTDYFYQKDTVYPIEINEYEYQCAEILNTLDYFTFLSYKKLKYEREKQILLK